MPCVVTTAVALWCLQMEDGSAQQDIIKSHGNVVCPSFIGKRALCNHATFVWLPPCKYLCLSKLLVLLFIPQVSLNMLQNFSHFQTESWIPQGYSRTKDFLLIVNGENLYWFVRGKFYRKAWTLARRKRINHKTQIHRKAGFGDTTCWSESPL